MFHPIDNELKYICGPKLGPQINKSRTLPYAYTEHGVAMLATILKTKIADEINLKIIDAFVSMRKYIATNLIEQKYINIQANKKIKKDFRILSVLRYLVSNVKTCGQKF
jgi:hypothetical protein